MNRDPDRYFRERQLKKSLSKSPSRNQSVDMLGHEEESNTPPRSPSRAKLAQLKADVPGSPRHHKTQNRIFGDVDEMTYKSHERSASKPRVTNTVKSSIFPTADGSIPADVAMNGKDGEPETNGICNGH